jgi:hypothetical protein
MFSLTIKILLMSLFGTNSSFLQTQSNKRKPRIKLLTFLSLTQIRRLASLD